MLRKHMNMQVHQLERLNKDIEVRVNRAQNLYIRNKWLQQKNIKNYQSEYDRIRGHMENSVMPYVTTAKVKNRKKELEKLGAQAFDTMREYK